MASIISFTFREAVVDVEYKGKDRSNIIFFFWEKQTTDLKIKVKNI